MNRHVATYRRSGQFVGIGWITTATGMSASQVNKAVTRGELPPPSPNAVPGQLLWDRNEAQRFIDSRGMRRTLKAFG
jgi:hypothetical protein